jgi:Protein of unknown function (DUF2946)
MRGLRKFSLLRKASAWTAIVATIIHVAMLSLHIAAAFERGLGPQQDVTASLGIHAFCGVDVSPSDVELAPDDETQPGSKESRTNCPLCVGAAPAACIAAPVTDVTPVAFLTIKALPYAALVRKASRPHSRVGTIRGPPAII